MSRRTKVGIAVVLGLICILSAFSSGAFAQSINRSSAHAVTHAIVTVQQDLSARKHRMGNHEPGDNWQGNNWNRNCGWQANCRWRLSHNGCVRVVKWVGWWRAAHPVTYWVCRH